MILRYVMYMVSHAKHTLRPFEALFDMRHYARKMRGRGQQARRPSKPQGVVALESFVGAFVAIFALSALAHAAANVTSVMLIGSFGASATMIFGAPQNPYAQPRHVLGGHMISAACGVSAALLFDGADLALWSYVSSALAVSSAMALMHLTRTFHPPGGATALIAVIGGPEVQALGFGYIIVPVMTGMLVLVVFGLLINNVFRGRRYPSFWW